jgi:hypothetical protein
MNCLIAYADGVRVAIDAQVPDIYVKIPGGQIETRLRTQGDVEVAGGVVLKRTITKSCVIGSRWIKDHCQRSVGSVCRSRGIQQERSRATGCIFICVI